jgi:hypothetical protein
MASNNGYPFITQAQVVLQINIDRGFAIRCLQVLCGRQTSDELEEKTTKYTNKRGLRCSESVWMPELAAKLQNESEAVTSEEINRLVTTLPVYRKQLAAHFRKEQLEAKPELADKASVFGLKS